MTSNRPYLIRAIYDWIIDNKLTPYILVDAEYPAIQIPEEHVINGHIILNISPQACRGLHLGNDRIVFTARFSGNSFQVVVSPSAVLAIYSKENSDQGMKFDKEKFSRQTLTNKTSVQSKPVLKLVTKDE